MDRLFSMRVFCRVATLGSFTRAAQELDISVAVASRLVVDLERHTNTRLFNRSTRSVKLTERGAGYFQRCVDILDQLDQADAFMAKEDAQVAGKLRLLVSFSEGLQLLAPHLHGFRQRYPDVVLDIHLAERVVDIVAEGFDVAIQPRPYLGSGSVVARELMQARLVLCAAPAYLAQRGMPLTPEELAGHDCLTFAHEELRDYWPLHAEERAVRVVPHNVLTSNNIQVLLEGMRSGMGIGLAVEQLIQDDLARGSLQRVLPAYHAMPMDYFVVYPSRHYLPAKVRVMVDFLLGLFGRS